ncbi:MAG: HYR domain-containing protein, partial [Bacteroidota bacterium]
SCNEATAFTASNLGYTNTGLGGCLIEGQVLGIITGTYDECGGTLTQTWTFVDDCDRQIQHVQTITVSPAPQAAFVNPPQDIRISCDQFEGFSASTLRITNNGLGGCLISDDVLGIITGQYSDCTTLTQTWTFTDACNRTTTHTQTIIIYDNTPPTFTYVPPGATYECDEEWEFTGMATAEDNCDDNVTITWEDHYGSCNHDGRNIPASGNGLVWEIKISDTGLSASDINKLSLIFSTNKGKGVAEFTLISPSGQGVILVGPYCNTGDCIVPDNPGTTYMPVFYKSDGTYAKWNNNNYIPDGVETPFEPYGGTTSINESYIISLLASEGITWKGYVPGFNDFTGNMDGTWRIYSRKQANAIGNVNYIGACLMPGQCPQEYHITRTWTATDNCGNRTTATTTVNVADTRPPVITCPAPIQVTAEPGEDDALVTLIDPTATDNCTTDPDGFTYHGVRSDALPLTDPYPVGVTTITWTAMDECGNISSPCTQTITVLPGCTEPEIYVFLEGALANPDGTGTYGSEMRTTLNDLRILPGQVAGNIYTGTWYTPAGQPYSSAPWDYGGTEGSFHDSGGDIANAGAGYPSTVVDWVLVSLRATPSATAEPACQAAALLHRDGRLEFKEGFCCVVEPGSSWYIVVEHRNHLMVMSAGPVPVVNGKIVYDFRNKQSYIYDEYNFGYAGQKEVSPGRFVMIGGNGDQTSTGNADTDVNVQDNLLCLDENGTILRYRRGDYNMNGDTNVNDRLIWQFNNGKITSVPRN